MEKLKKEPEYCAKVRVVRLESGEPGGPYTYVVQRSLDETLQQHVNDINRPAGHVLPRA